MRCAVTAPVVTSPSLLLLVSPFPRRAAGYLSAAGFGGADVSLLPSSEVEGGAAGGGGGAGAAPHFAECVFEVAPAINYEQHVKLAAAREKRARGPVSSEEERDTRRLEKLADAEARMNEENNRKLAGAVVTYGHAIQLLHRASNTFLSTNSRGLARSERENSLLVLDGGSAASHMQLLPPFKHRRLGDGVHVRDVTYVVGVQHKLYIHVSARHRPLAAGGPTPLARPIAIDADAHGAAGGSGAAAAGASGEASPLEAGPRREVNMSSDPTLWRLHVYSGATRDDNALKGGDTVRLLHFEREATLSAESVRGTAAPYLQARGMGDRGGRSARGEDVDATASTNNLWEIELEDPRSGAALEWSSNLRLRHANTGRYLSAARAPGGAVGSLLAAAAGSAVAKGAAKELTVTTVRIPTHDCNFVFEPTTPGALGAVPVMSGVRVQVRSCVCMDRCT